MYLALVLVLGLVAFDVFRRPSLRRLAVRNIVRRPGEAALVVLGSMLGTAIICTAFIVGDTFGESIRAIAPQKLGEVDIEIVATEPSKLLPAVAAADLGSIEGIDGTLPFLRIGATATTVGEDRVAETMSGLIELYFDAARTFGSDPATTGLADAGATPAPGETVIGRDLADELAVDAGDTIEVFGYGTSRQLIVRGVVERRGLAGYGSYAWNNLAPTVFVAPGTIDGMRAEGKAPGCWCRPTAGSSPGPRSRCSTSSSAGWTRWRAPPSTRPRTTCSRTPRPRPTACSSSSAASAASA
jgi:putative ABC transport system permease protein